MTSSPRRVWPVRLGDQTLAQCDERSCGAAALVMLAATGDPHLASWLAGGDLHEESDVPEVPRWARLNPPPTNVRFEVAQRHLRSGSANRAALPRWPRALGTLPMDAARLARYQRYTYGVRWLLGDAAKRSKTLTYVAQCMESKVPCLLYVGGGPHETLTRRVPRHVALAVPPKRRADVDVLNIYEPDSAALHQVGFEQLDDGKRKAAFGNWSRIFAVIVPKKL